MRELSKPQNFCSAIKRSECHASDNSTGSAFDWGQALSAIESTAVTIAKIATTPTGVQYVPGTGTYQPIPGTASAATAQLTSSAPLLLLLGFGLVAILLLRK